MDLIVHLARLDAYDSTALDGNINARECATTPAEEAGVVVL
jgi:hypothetical protein